MERIESKESGRFALPLSRALPGLNNNGLALIAKEIRKRAHKVNTPHLIPIMVLSQVPEQKIAASETWHDIVIGARVLQDLVDELRFVQEIYIKVTGLLLIMQGIRK